MMLHDAMMSQTAHKAAKRENKRVPCVEIEKSPRQNVSTFFADMRYGV